MENHQRSQCRKRAPFPKELPKGCYGGNENPFSGHFDVKSLFECGNYFYGNIITKLGAYPAIGIQVLTKQKDGSIHAKIEWEYNPRIEPTSGTAGFILFCRQFKRFFRAVKRFPKSSKVWSYFLSLDNATLAKDPFLMGGEVSKASSFARIQKALRNTRKTDDLDYLLANRYMAEGWNKMRLAEVGKIVARRLKLKKPVPATTLNRRLGDLELRCLPEGRPQTMP